MGLCPSCGAELAENLVEAIKDPSQPDVKCPYPWRGITNRPVPHMTDEIAGRLLDAIFEGDPPPKFRAQSEKLPKVGKYYDIFEDLDKLIIDDLRAESFASFNEIEKKWLDNFDAELGL